MRHVLRLAALLATVVTPAAAQNVIIGNDQSFRVGPPREASSAIRQAVATAPAAEIKALDKLTGQARALSVTAEEPVRFGRLELTMSECRYPRNNPTGDGFAYLSVREDGVDQAVFEGWMVASSPALNAMDHARFDIWLIRCKLDDRTPSVVAGESSPRPLMRP